MANRSAKKTMPTRKGAAAAAAGKGAAPAAAPQKVATRGASRPPETADVLKFIRQLAQWERDGYDKLSSDLPFVAFCEGEARGCCGDDFHSRAVRVSC